MRKLIVLLATAGLLLGFTGSAQAGDMDEHASTLGLIIGGLPSVTISATPGTGGPSPPGLVLLGDGSFVPGFSVGHNILVQSTVWSTINFGPGTSLFTGVPLVSNLKFTVSNRAGVLQSSGINSITNSIGGGHHVQGFGGILRLRGVSIIHAFGAQLPVPLDHVGGLMGETTMATLLGNNITATNGPFVTDTWKITGITSNIITIPQRANVQGVAFTLGVDLAGTETGMTLSTNGGYVSISGGFAKRSHMVTITGTQNLLSGSKQGWVTVIAPLRIATGAIANTIPGSATISLHFVPEPGTMLLLISGAVGLAVIGRRRMRK